MNRLIIGFFLLQVIFDVAHSITAFPFVHYGMFSESFSRPDSLSVYELIADGKTLQAGDFSIYQWDMTQTPLKALEKQIQTRDFAFDKEKMDAGMARIGMRWALQFAKPNLDNRANTAARFPEWYKSYLGRLLGHPIKTLRVDKMVYRFIDGHCLVIKRENRITI
jgi:hypothetical protein